MLSWWSLSNWNNHNIDHHHHTQTFSSNQSSNQSIYQSIKYPLRRLENILNSEEQNNIICRPMTFLLKLSTFKKCQLRNSCLCGMLT